MKKDDNQEFVSLIEDETRTYKDLKVKVKEKIKNDQEVVVPIEDKHCNCDKDYKCDDNCSCKNNRSKINILIIILIGLFSLGLGTVLGKLYLNEEKECDICPESNCDELYYERFYGDDISLNSKRDITDFMFLTFLTIENDARNCFTNSESCDSFDDFKIAYVLANKFDGNGIFKFDDLNNEVKKVFASGISYKDSYISMMIKTKNINVICTDEVCTYDISKSNSSGYSTYKYVIEEEKNISNRYTYIIKEYYVVSGFGNQLDKIYDKQDGNLLYEGNEISFDYKQYLDKLNTYEINFNSNYKFVGSKIVK